MYAQEAGNVPYVVNGGFGVFTGCRPKRIAETVLNLFADSTGSKLKKMSDNARAQSRPEATRAIAKDIATMTLSPSKFAIAK
jgi:UDP-N-acetylglucosamine:LPS N-acetylglucosamine transferase